MNEAEEKTERLLTLVEAAFGEGWNCGVTTDREANDSPEWNAWEDWLDSASYCESRVAAGYEMMEHLLTKETGGCLSNNCHIEKPKGQGVNGPCSCLNSLGSANKRAILRKIYMLEQDVNAKQIEIGHLKHVKEENGLLEAKIAELKADAKLR